MKEVYVIICDFEYTLGTRYGDNGTYGATETRIESVVDSEKKAIKEVERLTRFYDDNAYHFYYEVYDLE